MDNSSFAKLSGELRNRIYEYALREGDGEQETIDLEQGWFDCPFHRCRVMNEARTGFVHPLDPLRITGLPFASKAIRRESVRLYYHLNSFYFETDYLKSKHKDRIMERLMEWVQRVGLDQAKEIRDVTISLSSLKGSPAIPLLIDWNHMKMIRSVFSPQGRVRIRFYLDGNGSATFTLGSKEDMLEQLDRMAESWALLWRRSRKYDEWEAWAVAERYKQEVAELFKDMPEVVSTRMFTRQA